MLFSMTYSVHTFSEFFVVVMGAWASCRVTSVQGGNWRLFFFSALLCGGGGESAGHLLAVGLAARGSRGTRAGVKHPW